MSRRYEVTATSLSEEQRETFDAKQYAMMAAHAAVALRPDLFVEVTDTKTCEVLFTYAPPQNAL